MNPVVVDGFDPGGEQFVELGQIRDRAGHPLSAQLDEELLPDGSEEPFDLAASGGLAGLGVRERDAQAGQCAQ